MNNIVYISPISSRSGYGDCSRDIAKVLLNMHSDSLKFLNTKWGNCPTTGLKGASEFNNTIKSNTIIKPESDVDVTYQVALPSEFKRLGKHNIGITAGLEFTHWPNEFVNGCNEMDKVIVLIILCTLFHFSITKKEPKSSIISKPFSTPKWM